MTPQITNSGAYSCPTLLSANSKVDAVIDAARATAPTTTLDSAIDYRAKEWAYEEILDDSSLLTADTTIQRFYDSVAIRDMGAAVRASNELEKPDTTTAIIETALVSPITDILGNHKEALEIRVDDGEIDSVELSQLLALAAQCEELGGKAVNMARSMLALEGIYIWEDPECGPPPKEVRKAGISDQEATAYGAECWPNPADGMVFLKFAGAEVAGTLTVHGSSGQVLLSRRFDYTGEPIAIDTRHWAQGLTLVSVETVDGRRFAWRVVLQR